MFLVRTVMDSLLIASETFETNLCWNSDSEIAHSNHKAKKEVRKPRSHSAAAGETSSNEVESSKTGLFPSTIHGSFTKTRKPRARLRPAATSSDANSSSPNKEDVNGADTERIPDLVIQSVPNTPVKKVPLSRRTRERLHAALRSSVQSPLQSPRHKINSATSSSSSPISTATGSSPLPNRHGLDAHNGGYAPFSVNGSINTGVGYRRNSRPASANSNSSRESLSSYPCTASSFEYPAENKTSRQRKALAHRLHGSQCNGKCNATPETTTNVVTNSPIRPPRHIHRHRHHVYSSPGNYHCRSHSDTRSTDSSVTGDSGGSDPKPTRAASETRTSTTDAGKRIIITTTSSTASGSIATHEYQTPLQRKDRIIRDLKGELRASHKLIGVYERQVEKLKEKQQTDETIRGVMDDKDRDITDLKEQLSEARERCSDLMERHEIDGRTLEELRMQIQDYIVSIICDNSISKSTMIKYHNKVLYKVCMRVQCLFNVIIRNEIMVIAGLYAIQYVDISSVVI